MYASDSQVYSSKDQKQVLTTQISAQAIKLRIQPSSLSLVTRQNDGEVDLQLCSF